MKMDNENIVEGKKNISLDVTDGTTIRVPSSLIKGFKPDYNMVESGRYDSSGNMITRRKKTASVDDIKITDLLLLEIQQNFDQSFKLKDIKNDIEDLYSNVLIQLESKKKQNLFLETKIMERIEQIYANTTVSIPYDSFLTKSGISSRTAMDAFKKVIAQRELSGDNAILDDIRIKKERIYIEDNLLLTSKLDDKDYQVKLKDGKAYIVDDNKELHLAKTINFYNKDNNIIYNAEYDDEKKQFYYEKITSEVYSTFKNLGIINSVNVNFSSDVMDEINELKEKGYKELEIVEKLFDKRKKNKTTIFTNIIFKLDSSAIALKLNTINNSWASKIQAFRAKMSKTESTFLDDLIRKRLINGFYGNIIEFNNYEEFKLELGCSDSNDKYFKNQTLKKIVKEFNDVTEDIQILEIKEIRKEGRVRGAIEKIQIVLENKNHDILIDFTAYQISLMKGCNIKNFNTFKYLIRNHFYTPEHEFYGQTIQYWREVAEFETSKLPLLEKIVNLIAPILPMISLDKGEYTIRENQKFIKEVRIPSKAIEYIKENLPSNDFYEVDNYFGYVKYRNKILDFRNFNFYRDEIMEQIINKKSHMFTYADENSIEIFESFVNHLKSGMLINYKSEIEILEMKHEFENEKKSSK